MIIRRIQIENYLCYYGTCTFELSKGLNIILGENGEGKTKFFEAIEWLFNGQNRELALLVSAKKLDETAVGDSFRVGVSMNVEQHGDKSIITKSFLVKKEGENECSTSNFIIEGVSENNSGERTQVDGQTLLDRIFPFQIRKYSMFKGEAELDIFKKDKDNALVNLINLFSEARHYDKYSEKGAFLREKAERAVEESTRSDKKNVAQYKKLENDIFELKKKQDYYRVHYDSVCEEIRKLDENIQGVESYVENAESIVTINNRISAIRDKISNIESLIDENYTTSLFDENWILVNFEPIHMEFAKKVSEFSKRRRELQSAFDIQKGIKVGIKKTKSELLNNATPLPVGVPSKVHMEEMLKDEICKVCNREAKVGTEAYEFMMSKLKVYLESQDLENDQPELDDVLFKFDYTNRLENLSTSHEDNLKNLRLIRSRIKELFAYNNDRKKEIEELNIQLEQEETERSRIIGNAGLAEEKLKDVFKNYNSWQRDLRERNKEQLDYEARIKRINSELSTLTVEKDKIDISSASSFLLKTRDILRDIETIFRETKEKKFNDFIVKMQSKSNAFFKEINIDAFTGTIVFNALRKMNTMVVEVVLQEDGRTFYKPNQSLLTSMHISILFAISELAAEIKEENFPMIFDAPTSSFGENKTAQFLNLISETESQKILLIKDFLQTDKSTNVLSIKKEFDSVRRDKAFWVKLERPFDPNNLKTISSQVITL